MRADEDVVDIEENPAVGSPGHFAEELPLGHRGLFERNVAGDILEKNLPPQDVLHRSNPIHHVVERFFRIRKKRSTTWWIGFERCRTSCGGRFFSRMSPATFRSKSPR